MHTSFVTNGGLCPLVTNEVRMCIAREFWNYSRFQGSRFCFGDVLSARDKRCAEQHIRLTQVGIETIYFVFFYFKFYNLRMQYRVHPFHTYLVKCTLSNLWLNFEGPNFRIRGAREFFPYTSSAPCWNRYWNFAGTLLTLANHTHHYPDLVSGQSRSGNRQRACVLHLSLVEVTL